MKDPHTQESRGFGFVKMVTAEQADAAKEGLQGEVIDGRTLSIEKARRARPRTPTPGKYFGPPKRGKFSHIFSRLRLIRKLDDDMRGPPRRFDDRRGGGYGGGYRSDRGDNYRSRYDDRERYSSHRRDDYGSRGIDRYASSGRDDRYTSRGDRGDRGDDRRDYGGRDGGRSSNTAYGDSAPSRDTREPYGGRGYDDRNFDDRYSRR